MSNESDLKYDGNQILFADHATDFGTAPATAANSLLRGSQTDVQLDLTGIAASGGARQSAKVSIGDPRASMWAFDACLEFEGAPSDGGTVDFYWCDSPSATAGIGNAAGLTGSDAAFTDTSGNLGQLKHIGSLTVKNTVINIGYVGTLRANHENGILVTVNNTDKALRSTATAMDETHITATPLAYVPGA